MGTGLSALAFIYFPEYALEFATGCLIGLLVTPDLDIDHRSYTEELMWEFPPFGWVFQQLYYGYALLFRHRGWSHNIIVGTLSRVVWTALIALLIAAIISGIATWLNIYAGSALTTAKVVILFMLHPILLLGWWAQDANHLLLDWIFSEK